MQPKLQKLLLDALSLDPCAIRQAVVLWRWFRLRRWQLQHDGAKESKRLETRAVKDAAVANTAPEATFSRPCNCACSRQEVRSRGEFIGEHKLTVCPYAWEKLCAETAALNRHLPNFQEFDTLVFETVGGQVTVQHNPHKHKNLSSAQLRKFHDMANGYDAERLRRVLDSQNFTVPTKAKNEV